MEGISNLNHRITQRAHALFGPTLFVTLIAFVGCSASKPPTDAVTRAEFSVRAANEARANELASLDLKRATEKLEKAKQAMATRRYDEARRFAEGAQVDAELAEAKAETAVVRRAADDLQRRVDAVQTDAERESRKPLPARPEKD